MNNETYSERISHNEQRIAELKGRIYTDKLTIKSLEKENEKCIEAMNNCTHVVDTNKSNKDKKILKLIKENGKLKEELNYLKIEKTQLKHDLECAKIKLGT